MDRKILALQKNYQRQRISKVDLDQLHPIIQRKGDRMKWVLTVLIFILFIVFCLLFSAYLANAEDGHINADIDRLHQRLDRQAELILQMELEMAETKGVLKFLSWTLMAVGTVLVPIIVMFFTPLWEKRKAKDD